MMAYNNELTRMLLASIIESLDVMLDPIIAYNNNDNIARH